jgi:hypothetical protein
MKFDIIQNMKVERVENGVAVVTLRIPLNILDSLSALADYAIHFSHYIGTRSRVCLALDRVSSPGYQAELISIRADVARKEAKKRAARRATLKARGY